MDTKKIEQIFLDTAYVHTGGSEEELQVATYLQNVCKEWGLDAKLDPFAVDMSNIKKAVLLIDGKEIPCKGYFMAGSAEVEAPLYYMTGDDKMNLSLCKGKIVLMEGGVRYWLYQDLLENGAVGFITYNGDMHAPIEEMEIEQKELRSYISNGKVIPGVSTHVNYVLDIIESGATTAKIILEQDEYKGTSNNIVLDLPGETDRMITLTAHYDSTPLSQGAYDNMSGSIVLLGIAKYFAEHPHHYSLRFIWCGSEERGLLGSKAYVAAHEEDLEKMDLVVNVDMIGCTMGPLKAFCTCETDMVGYINYFGRELGCMISAAQDIYSSDSTPFADKGIPAVSFARMPAAGTGAYHSRKDTIKVVSMKRMAADTEFVTAFVDRMANAKILPVVRTMPDEMKDKIDKYLTRKR